MTTLTNQRATQTVQSSANTGADVSAVFNKVLSKFCEI